MKNGHFPSAPVERYILYWEESSMRPLIRLVSSVFAGILVFAANAEAQDWCDACVNYNYGGGQNCLTCAPGGSDPEAIICGGGCSQHSCNVCSVEGGGCFASAMPVAGGFVLAEAGFSVTIVDYGAVVISDCPAARKEQDDIVAALKALRIAAPAPVSD
jgi:hypothetical protein